MDPTPASLPARLPRATQIAYLVPDLDAAVKFWAETMGVGPFRILRHIEFVEGTYMDQPVHADLSIALAWCGSLQLELMQQHNADASVFVDHAPAGGGFHHLGIHSTDIRADEARLLEAGFTLLQRNLSATGTETLFFGGVPGLGVVELIHSPTGGAFGERLRQAAETWDRVDPILPPL